MKPEFYLDENLRYLPKCEKHLKEYVSQLQRDLSLIKNSVERVSLLGEIAVYLRILNKFSEAKELIAEALEIISSENLGVQKKIQQEIRLAHIYQDEKDFKKSDALFLEIIETCDSNNDAYIYYDFALQHSGKNLFDQKKYREALSFFEKAYEIRQRKNTPKDQLESTIAAIKRAKELLGENESY